MDGELLHKEITDHIIKAFYRVYNALGNGFLEKVYRNSIAIVLSEMGHRVEKELPINVCFEGHLVGEYFADLIVDGCVIVELKAAEAIVAEHEAQLLNYPRATEVEVGLVMNFGPEAKFIRRVFTNARKKSIRANPPNPHKSASGS